MSSEQFWAGAGIDTCELRNSSGRGAGKYDNSTRSSSGRLIAGAGATMKYAEKDIHRMIKHEPFLQEALYCADELYPELQSILDSELAVGNLILGASRGWPTTGSIFIQLVQPFSRQYSLGEGMEYYESNDYHFEKAGYQSGSPVHVLACSWK